MGYDNPNAAGTVGKAEGEPWPSYAWPGGYSIVYYMADGEPLCPKCMNEERPEADPDGWRESDWTLAEAGVRWEGPAEQCMHCGKDMPSEYGDPEENV